ncbi:hypothetical protein [Nostoc linckia]|nr:hypothetical protein [Nostoc linckia]
MGRWGDGEMGETREKDCYLVYLVLFPCPMPHAQCPMPNAPCPVPCYIIKLALQIVWLPQNVLEMELEIIYRIPGVLVTPGFGVPPGSRNFLVSRSRLLAGISSQASDSWYFVGGGG